MTTRFKPHGDRTVRIDAQHAVLRSIFFAALVLLVSACAGVSLYSVDLRYDTSHIIHKVDQTAHKFFITVARFNDARPTKDKTLIGHVITSDGRRTPVLPKFVTPEDAVTRGFKDYLNRSGYNVSGLTPVWDLREDAINPEWGKVVIGGTIDDLDIECIKTTPIRKYTAKAKFSLVVASVRDHRILYRITVESNPSLEHIRFSEEKLEEVINEALSIAVNKIFESTDIHRKIMNAAEGII
jgi:hypothetical protein